MSEPARVSVIVPHYNDLDSLASCLESLGRQTYPRSLFEIIVADNASPQGVEAIESLIAGRAQLIVVDERGAGPARNGGVAVASGDVLAFIDCDCIAEPGWIAAGVAMLGAYDVVGGGMRVLVEGGRPMTGPEAFERVFAFDNRKYVEERGFTVTANLFCTKAVFSTVGGFRVGVSEDYDWCHRATSAGYSLGYGAEAVVGHPARRTWADLQKKWRRLNQETFALYAERRAGRLSWFIRALALPASVLVHIPRVLRSSQLSSGAERVSALGTLARLRLWRFADALRLLFRGA